MSTSTTTQPDDQTDEQSTEERLDQLEETVEDLQDDKERLQETVSKQAARINNLEDELESNATIEWPKPSSQSVVLHAPEQADWETELPLMKWISEKAEQRYVDELDEALEDVEDELQKEQIERTRAVSVNQARINTVAEKAGVEEVDDALIDEDKLVRLVRNGPEDIYTRVYDAHRRARALLVNAEDWAREVSTQQGTCIRYSAPEVRPYLESKYNTSFSTTQIKRIFEKIEDVAGESPRLVRLGKNGKGEHVLDVYQPGELLEVAEGMQV